MGGKWSLTFDVEVRASEADDGGDEGVMWMG